MPEQTEAVAQLISLESERALAYYRRWGCSPDQAEAMVLDLQARIQGHDASDLEALAVFANNEKHEIYREFIEARANGEGER